MRRDIAEKKDLLDERMTQIENVTQQLQSAEVRRLSDDEDGDRVIACVNVLPAFYGRANTCCIMFLSPYSIY